MSTKNTLLGLACLMCVFAGAVSATTINYDVTNIAGNTWEYTYTVSNDTLGFDIEEFTIFFDYTAYENLIATATPSGWDPLVIPPDPGLPDDGFYDALVIFGSSIGVGGSLGGFSVQFDYLLAGTPGAQFFDVVDPFTFDVLDSGLTTAVPVPAAIWLFGSGLLMLVGRARLNSRQAGLLVRAA